MDVPGEDFVGERVLEIFLDRALERARAVSGIVAGAAEPGARPLKRAVQKYLQDPLADEILAGRIHDGSTVKVDAGQDGLVIKLKPE